MGRYSATFAQVRPQCDHDQAKEEEMGQRSEQDTCEDNGGRPSPSFRSGPLLGARLVEDTIVVQPHGRHGASFEDSAQA